MSGNVARRLFGTNGVRGIVNQTMTVELATRLAASVGTVLGKRIALGRDARLSSPVFRYAAAAGLQSVGCKVHDMGMLPTPALQYATKHLALDGGIMITASHNPPEFNGVKVMASDGVEIPRSLEVKIEDLYFKDSPDLASWDQVGKLEELEVLDKYKSGILSQVDSEEIRAAQLKIAIDTGNGVGILTAPDVAESLGCDVYTINATLDGRFPSRDSEPRPDNLGGLQALVKASEADFGVAFDGDADRSLFVDEKGSVVWGDRSLALLADWFLGNHPGEKVATCVSSSRIMEDVADMHGGEVHWTCVGAPDVSRAMVKHNILFGGEENGGVMYGPHQPVRDGTMAMALMAQLLAKKGMPLSKMLAELPYYAQAKGRVPCENRYKEEALMKLRNTLKAPKVETIDGLKLHFRDGSWILIRPSGTEPVFRIYAESSEKRKVESLVDEYQEKIEKIVSSLR
ncbi:MAG: phosphoglucosamine mutase [Candidatus Bathyarchaeia archaeon]